MHAISPIANQSTLPQRDIVSSAQGAIGKKVEITGTVIYQTSRAVDIPTGRVYSHFHIILDDHGNLYHYKGSSFFPKANRVHISATVKSYTRGDTPRSVVTIIRAPKSL